ncbi:MAG: hypothetical protein NTU54_05615 [Candidatus Omnitrophica bacterium]|nr:hypothetical protein [Candidatus Omnitrophota bacterium]
MDTVKPANVISTRIFSLKDVLYVSLVFVLLLNGSNFLVRALKKIAAFKIPRHWPVSEFYRFTIIPQKILLAASALVLFYYILKYLSSVTRKGINIIGLGILLVLITNFFQGVVFGFILPITSKLFPATELWQYYDQAVKISHPMYFFSHFESFQLGLYQHSITHPPGATLIFYWLHKLCKDPALIAILIAVFSVFVSGIFLYKILSRELEAELSGYVTFLFLLIPAIQIYYLACLEALVASLLLGALFFFIHPKPIVSIAGSILFLFFSSCLTFLFVFIFPVLFGYQFLKKRSPIKPIIILLGIVISHAVIYHIFHYNYLNSFWIASSYENIGRATPLFHTLEYLVTRLEGVFEIILFFGPFLGILFLRGMRARNTDSSFLRDLTTLGVSTLIIMFIAGFFRTGETARICLFIYPYLIFPVAAYFKEIRVSPDEKVQVLALVFIQTVIMQLLGSYYW